MAVAAPEELLELSRAQVAKLICRGHLLVLHRNQIYRLNNFAKSHPGGTLAILHFVGRDAVDELEAFHDEATQKKMKTFLVGRAQQGWTDEAGWTPLIPPVQLHNKGWEKLDHSVWQSVESWKAGLASLENDLPLTSTIQHQLGLPPISPQDLEPGSPPPGIIPSQQHELQADYRKLHDLLIQKGFYKPTPFSNYRYEFLRYALFFSLAMCFYFKATTTCRALSCVGLLFRSVEAPVGFHSSRYGSSRLLWLLFR